MPTRDRPAFRGARQWARLSLELGAELRDARREAGLTQALVAAAVGISQMEVSRIERGRSPQVPAAALSRIAAVIGLRLWLKLYPDGPPIRDAGQQAEL